MGASHTVLLFESAYLAGDTASGDVERTVSRSVPVNGNRIVIEATLINASGLDDINKLVLVLEGTYDGKVWICPAASSTIEFLSDAPESTASSPYTDVSYSDVRLRATINGISAKALFNASIALSTQ